MSKACVNELFYPTDTLSKLKIESSSGVYTTSRINVLLSQVVNTKAVLKSVRKHISLKTRTI